MSRFRFEDCLLNSDGARTPFKASSGSQKKKNVQPHRKRKKELKNETNHVQLDFGSKVENNTVILTLPLRTVSEANCFEPWQKRHKRHKAQKKAVFFAILEHKHLITLPCTLTFVRYAPKSLDKHDNLPMSLKFIVDQTCAEITGEHRAGLADNNDQITIKYDQVKSKVYGVKIIIEF